MAKFAALGGTGRDHKKSRLGREERVLGKVISLFQKKPYDRMPALEH